MIKIRLISNAAITAAFMAAAFLSACRGDDPDTGSSSQVGGEEELEEIRGFFMLNEGNMNTNMATIDYYDYTTGIYTSNIFSERNPTEVKELGDVGNDIQIYGNKLYAVINVSNFLEVMDVTTAKHITKITIPNCRYVTFKDQYAYVSSYAGEVNVSENARIGYVAKVDTLTLKVVDECIVGYQPEQMVVVGNKLYVANSGGYRVPNYDTTVSVIDLDTFTEEKKIEVAINLHQMQLDNYGYIYVSSRGDYYNIPSKTYIIDTKTDTVVKELELLPCSNMAMYNDLLYVTSVETDKNVTPPNVTVSYAILDTKTQTVVSRDFIKDGTEQIIKTPYGLAVNPDNGDIFVTDAGTYTTDGIVYCFSNDGILKWSKVAGNIPAHFAFTRKKLLPTE